MTEAFDSDSGEFSVGTVRVRLAVVAPGESHRIRFRARIDGAVTPGTTLFNTADLTAAGVTPVATSRVEALVGIAAPVERYDFSALLYCTKPKFLIQAERDDLAPLRAAQRFYARLPEPRELVVIEGADHAFDGKASEVGEAIEDLLGDYRDRLF